MERFEHGRGADVTVGCRQLPAALAERVVPLLEAAVINLDLQRDLAAVSVCGDDLPGQDDVWLQVTPSDVGERGLVVYCHPAVFLERAPANSTLLPPPESWDRWETAVPEEDFAAESFSIGRTDDFLHHSLLLARDLLRGDLVTELIPAALGEAFQAAWSVGLDGRLQRAHLPGYDLAERRGRFSRLFSTAGVLLPDHWQLFQALWDGAVSGQSATLDLVRRLPRL